MHPYELARFKYYDIEMTVVMQALDKVMPYFNELIIS